MSTYRAVAEHWEDGQFDLWIQRDDGGTVFGDMVGARTRDNVEANATHRLEKAGWRVIAGEWTRDGDDRWTAPVELVEKRP